MLSGFFDTGEVDVSRFERQPMSFDVRLGFQDVARAMLGAAVGVAFLIVAAPVLLL